MCYIPFKIKGRTFYFLKDEQKYIKNNEKLSILYETI